MASELLVIPEENLEETLQVIKLGIAAYHDAHFFKSPHDTIERLEQWCAEVEDYLERT